MLWTHEHFTIVLMAYLWQLGSRRALRRGLFIFHAAPAATRAVDGIVAVQTHRQSAEGLQLPAGEESAGEDMKVS